MSVAAGLPEVAELERIVALAGGLAECRELCSVDCGSGRLPVLAILLGNPAADRPGVGIFGGVHGLERIGAEVATSCLHSLVMRLRWDETLHRLLEGLRLVFVPMVNPGGILRGTRANPAGVDLMRNAPVECREGAPFLIGGQRIGPRLPWYRGPAGGPMAVESEALCKLVAAELLQRPFALAVDCHSGFGLNDRIWFPYAHTVRPIEHLAEMHALSAIFSEAHPNHRYVIEPQSRQYLAHGDLWDYLYGQSLQAGTGCFLPLTLEMGSWIWIKKNPRQMFSRSGIFNPLILHRQQRVLRRHLGLLDFMLRAAGSYRRWLPQGDERTRGRGQALAQWYFPESR